MLFILILKEQQILHIYDTDYVVSAFVIHRESGEFILSEYGNQIIISRINMDKRHINTRNHDLLGLGIAKIEYIVNHITLFILDDTVLLSYINDCTKLLLGHDALGIALSYSEEENDSE